MRNHLHYLKIIMLLPLLMATSGCDKQIDGLVHDENGLPLEGVSVKIVKSRFSANTDSHGSYSIDYAPGHINILFSKTGYTKNTLSLDIQQKTAFPAETIVLHKYYRNNSSPEKLSKSIIHTLITNDEEAFKSFAFPKKEVLLNFLQQQTQTEEHEKVIKEIKMMYEKQKNKVFSSWAKMQNEGVNWKTAKYERVEYNTRYRKSDIKTADIYIIISSEGAEYKLKLDDSNLISDTWYVFDEMQWKGLVE